MPTCRNTTEATELANCLHENTKKVKKFGSKCRLCKTRVWKYWKARKCLDCGAVLHKSCVVNRKNEDARNPAVNPTNAIEVQATGAETTVAARTVGYEDAPLYATPALWSWENLTAVMVDCRGRPEPLVLMLSRGRDLTAAMLAGLFDAIPARRSDDQRWYARARDAGDAAGRTARPSGDTARRRTLPCLEAAGRV